MSSESELLEKTILKHITSFKRDFFESGLHYKFSEEEKLLLNELSLISIPKLMGVNVNESDPKDIEEKARPFVQTYGKGTPFLAVGMLEALSKSRDTKELETLIRSTKSQLDSSAPPSAKPHEYIETLYTNPTGALPDEDYYNAFFRYHIMYMADEIIKYITRTEQ